MKNILYRLFKLNRKCYNCKCKDCQETELRDNWWYCLHIKNNICDVCCIHDSLGSDCNWGECKTCPEEWKRVDITDEERMEKLGWEGIDRHNFKKDNFEIKILEFGEHIK